jgi:hypothetical protein
MAKVYNTNKLKKTYDTVNKKSKRVIIKNIDNCMVIAKKLCDAHTVKVSISGDKAQKDVRVGDEARPIGPFPIELWGKVLVCKFNPDEVEIYRM